MTSKTSQVKKLLKLPKEAPSNIVSLFLSLNES